MPHCSYPTVSREAVRMLDCSEDVEGTSYVQHDYSVSCDTSEHDFHAVIAVLVLLLFCTGLPVYSFIALYRERKAAKQVAALGHKRAASLVFLSQGGSHGWAGVEELPRLPQSYACLWLSPGYEENFYWWECVVMLRKFVLVLVAVLFSNQGNALQIYAGIGVVVFFLLIQLMAKPFADINQDHLETAAQCCAVVSLCT